MNQLLIFLALTFTIASSYKILGVFPIDAKSHYAIAEATMRALHEAGHEVTMISGFELKKPLKKFRQIKISSFMKKYEEGQ